MICDHSILPAQRLKSSAILAASLASAGLMAAVVCRAEPLPARQDGQAQVVAKSPVPTLEQVERVAQDCFTTGEAVAVYKAYLARADLPQDVRLNAEKQIEKWLDRKRQELVRLGDAWVTKAEFAAKSKEAREFIVAADAFLKLKNVKMAQLELERASDTMADAGLAEIRLGLIAWDEHSRDYLAAMKHFQEAARRNPASVIASNNAAVAGFFAGRTTRLATDFQAALEHAGKEDAQVIVDNIATIIKSRGISSWHMDQLKELYREALLGMKLRPPEPPKPGNEVREVLVFFEPGNWGLPADGEGKDPWRGKEVDAAVHFKSGTGFVIGPNYVVTNHHVIEDAAEIALMNPKNNEEFFAAKVVASDAVVDLAILQCLNLDAPSLRLRCTMPSRGTELLSLGYPWAHLLGLGIKSTRGAVVAVPVGNEPRFLYDAIVNSGNSGGPLVDRSGSVVGVTVARRSGSGAGDMPYSVGIPAEAVLEFLAAKARGVKVSLSEGSEKLEWPEVDAQVSKSTVFVRCRISSEESEDDGR